MADVVNSIGLDVSQFNSGIRQITAALDEHNRKINESIDRYQQFNEANRRARSSLLSLNQAIRVLEVSIIHRAFSALVQGMRSSITEAAKLQVAISEIRTVAQQSGISFGEFQTKIRALSDEFGRPQAEIAEAAYQGFSNQVIRSSADMGVLNEALRLGRITVSSTATAMEALSSVINAYGRSTQESRQISDELFKAVEIGRFRLDEIGGTLGRVTVAANQVGISFQEVLASLTVVTRAGVPPAEAMTQLSSIMQALIRPSEEMRRVFREWGVDSGVAAVRTFGFTGVLRRLLEESDRGTNRLGELVHNVRALRAAFALVPGGGLSEFERDISRISSASRSAQAAFDISGESPGKRFLDELNRIKNFFINDFANAIINAAQNLAAPFGGIAELVKQVGTAIVGLFQIATQFASLFATISNSILKPFGANLGTLVLAYVALKGAVLAYNVVTSISAFLTIKASVSMAAMATASTTTATALRSATTAALTFGKALLSIFGVGAVLVGIGLLISNMTTLNSKFEESSRLLENLGRERERDRVIEDREATESLNDFRESLNARSRLLASAIATIRRGSNELVEQQRRVVDESTRNLNERFQAVRDRMSTIISDLRQKINESERAIQDSLRRVLTFRDRTATELFNISLRAAGTLPTRTRARPVSFQEEREEAEDLADAQQARATQIQLIERRTAQLRQDAINLTQRGDLESMESARRRFEELRRLTEQQFEIENESRRAAILHNATIEARRTGQSVRAVNVVPINQLEARLRGLTDLEQRGEEVFRAAQARRAELAEQELERQRANQRALNDLINNLTRFRLLNEQGELLPRFRQGGPAAALREFDALIPQIRARMQGLNLDARTSGAVWEAVERQRVAISEQATREIAAARLSESAQALIQNTQSIERQRVQAQDRINQGRASQRQVVTDAIRFTDTIRNAIDPGLNVFGNLFANFEQATGLTTTSAGARFRQQAEAVGNQVRNAAAEFQRAIATGTAEESAETENTLLDRLGRLRTVYVNFLNSLSQTERSRFLEQTGIEVSTAVSRVNEIYRSAGTNLRNAARGIQQGREEISIADIRSEDLVRNFQRLPPQLQAAVLQAELFGQAMQRAINPLNQTLTTFSENLNNIIGQLGTIQQRSNFVGPPAPGRFADGGLIGNAFNSYGADNTLIAARTGEFVVNPDSTRRFYSQLVAMNAGRFPRFADGGVVGSTSNFGDVTINVNEAQTPEATARAVMYRIRRETRRGSGRI